MFNGYFVMVCETCGKWVIDMIPKEITTTAIDLDDIEGAMKDENVL